MSLLNKDQGFYYLRTYEIPPNSDPNAYHFSKSHRPNSLLYNLRTWDDHDYWYVEIFHGNAFDIYPIDTIVPADVLEKIKTDQHTFLYICNTHEAFLDIVKPLYETLVIEEKIPARKIYISNEALELNNAVCKYADANQLEYMNTELVLEFEQQVSMQVNLMKLDGSTMLADKKYDKKFLNFNRRWRLQRPTLVALLKIHGLLDKGYVSLGESDDHNNWKKVYPWIKGHHRTDPELSKMFEEHEQDIVNMPPLYLDTQDLVTNRALVEENSFYLYENTLVSLVTETTFYTSLGMNGARFLSEKIFKPIGLGHPFIFVTVPKSLEALKTLGYKTFSPFIDESYDNEFDDFERLKKIVNEIKRISNFTDQEVKQFCQNVKPICEFNQNLIRSKTLAGIQGQDPNNSISHSNFVKKTL